MTQTHTDIYNQLVAHTRETVVLASVKSTLEWDEQTHMPGAAAPYRAEQDALLTGIIHGRRTDRRVGDWLDQLLTSPLAADRHSETGATIRELKREYDRLVKLPQALVEELARARAMGHQAWLKARADKNFAEFRPMLERIIRLKREQADAIGYRQCRYDALLDHYEPGASTAHVAEVLAALRDRLTPLVAKIAASGRHPKTEILERTYPIDAQRQFGEAAAARIGFDFQRGRLDVTVHPFCTQLGPHDCRLTTRYDEHHFPSAFFGIIHEAGHGLYDQGLRPDVWGLPPGDSNSHGIHESQSRMWENLVGRSRAFWDYFFPKAQTTFSAALGDVSLEDFYFAINDVRPSLIRVEADEATYNLHIIIRFELEQALLNDELAVADLPAAWNEKYRQSLGITPPDDLAGVLQDVHWSSGSFGYFPTYSLGNLFAAQFFETADRELGGLDAQFARGEFAPLLEWLRTKIHHIGRCYTATELIERVTGRPLSHEPLLAHLHRKFSPLYGI